ncbi:MAG: hypothetical protein LBH32_06520 [Dysgonamonadaceae bacterium]|jgi:hypothetical protein|nr:hypothetical protein [Dysgonamonadaceae bacterium]
MELTPIFVIGFLVLGTYKIIELFVKRKERLVIIEKFTSQTGLEPVRLPKLFYERKDFGSWSLRISLLLIGIGIGALCAFFIRIWCIETMLNHDLSTLYIACLSLFGGIGLFIAFLIELKQKNKQPDGGIE